MPSNLNRRTFMQNSFLSAACAASTIASAQQDDSKNESESALPTGLIKDMKISRLLLGGNLLTHYTHSRDLKYVYTLAQHYNTLDKILETMALAESHGINTLVIHTAPGVMNFLREYRYKRGGKMQWIVCPTAEIDETMDAYRTQVNQIVDNGVDAVYLWGVRSDQLVAQGKIDRIAKAVEIAKQAGVPSGVGAHDLRAVIECEKNGIDADFYIKTFHHHNYPTAPKPEEIQDIIAEIPGYWCNDPGKVSEFMSGVSKPWIAFKVMAAGAIPPKDAFQYAFDHGADHILAGMFDFEIAEDVRIAGEVLKNAKRQRAWMS